MLRNTGSGPYWPLSRKSGASEAFYQLVIEGLGCLFLKPWQNVAVDVPCQRGAAQSAPSLRSRASTGISWQPTFQSRVMRPPMAPMMAPPMLLTMRTMLGIGSP